MARQKVFGPVVVVTPKFREDLRTWLEAPGKHRSASKLARAIGCDRSAISGILNQPETYRTSTMVVPIVQHTGIAMPAAEPAAEDDPAAVMLKQILSLRESDPAGFELIVAFLHSRVGDKKP